MKVDVVMAIDATPEEAWPFLADWGGAMKIFTICESCVAEGEGLGATRVIRVNSGRVSEMSESCADDLGGQEIRETCVRYDPARHELSYSVEEPSLLPVTDYVATVRIEPYGDRRSRISWSSRSTLKDKGAEADALALFEGAYRDGIMGIERCAKAARTA